jgi:hypothetical protein
VVELISEGTEAFSKEKHRFRAAFTVSAQNIPSYDVSRTAQIEDLGAIVFPHDQLTSQMVYDRLSL